MLKAAKIIGSNSDQEAAQALVYHPTLSTTSQTPSEINLFMIIRVVCDDAFSRTRQALAQAEDVFNESTQELSKKLAETLEEISKTLSDTEESSVLLGATLEEESSCALYVISQGEGVGAYLLRGDVETDLCQISKSAQLVSGLLKPGDRVVFTTSNLKDALGGDFKPTAAISIDNIEEELALSISLDRGEPIAAVFIEDEVADEEGVEEVVPESIVEMEESKLVLLNIPKIRFKKILKLPLSLPAKLSHQGQKFIPFLIVIVFLVLGFLGYRTYKHHVSTATDNVFNQNFNKANDLFNKAQELKDSDPAGAAQSLASANQALAQALINEPNNSQALDLKNRINSESNGILKISQVNDFPLWLDLGLIKQGFTTQRLALSSNELLLLDPNTKTLVEVGLDNKSQQILAGKNDLGDGLFAALGGGIGWVYSTDKGLVKIDTLSDQVTNPIKIDSGWGKITDISAFGGNLYALDAVKNQIWKYLPIEGGYAEKRNYLQDGVAADFAGAKRLEIDSSVWVMKDDGEILKYTSGSSDFFAFSGLDKDVKDPKSFFVSADTKNFYLLDSGNNRLLVLTKQGAYQTQYQSPKFSSFDDLVVDESNNKVYLLGDNKIYQMALK